MTKKHVGFEQIDIKPYGPIFEAAEYSYTEGPPEWWITKENPYTEEQKADMIRVLKARCLAGKDFINRKLEEE